MTPSHSPSSEPPQTSWPIKEQLRDGPDKSVGRLEHDPLEPSPDSGYDNDSSQDDRPDHGQAHNSSGSGSPPSHQDPRRPEQALAQEAPLAGNSAQPEDKLPNELSSKPQTSNALVPSRPDAKDETSSSAIVPRKMAICKHRDRTVYARGLCGPCYQRFVARKLGLCLV